MWAPTSVSCNSITAENMVEHYIETWYKILDGDVKQPNLIYYLDPYALPIYTSSYLIYQITTFVDILAFLIRHSVILQRALQNILKLNLNIPQRTLMIHSFVPHYFSYLERGFNSSIELWYKTCDLRASSVLKDTSHIAQIKLFSSVWDWICLLM